MLFKQVDAQHQSQTLRSERALRELWTKTYLMDHMTCELHFQSKYILERSETRKERRALAKLCIPRWGRTRKLLTAKAMPLFQGKNFLTPSNNRPRLTRDRMPAVRGSANRSLNREKGTVRKITRRTGFRTCIHKDSKESAKKCST